MAKKLTAYERCELLYNKINTFQKKEGKVKVSFVADAFGPQLEMINHEAFVGGCLEKMRQGKKLTAADMVILNKLYDGYRNY